MLCWNSLGLPGELHNGNSSWLGSAGGPKLVHQALLGPTHARNGWSSPIRNRRAARNGCSSPHRSRCRSGNSCSNSARAATGPAMAHENATICSSVVGVSYPALHVYGARKTIAATACDTFSGRGKFLETQNRVETIGLQNVATKRVHGRNTRLLTGSYA